MARRRFRADRICSSENYKKSRETGRDFLKRFHENYKEEVEQISRTTKVVTKYYVKCFGKLVELSKSEAERLERTMKIIKR